MKISREEAHYAGMVLARQAREHRVDLGNASNLAPVFEQMAAALEKGETIEIERKRKA